MAREPKIRSKASQGQNARSKQRVAPAAAGLEPDSTQTIADTRSTISSEIQVTKTTATTDTTSDSSSNISTQQEQASVQQVGWAGLQPNWPNWPTSKPGPRSTPPAPGTHSINKFRPEQLQEVGYDQETGEPAAQSPLRSLPDERITGPTSFDQPTAQEVVGKRKQRL